MGEGWRVCVKGWVRKGWVQGLGEEGWGYRVEKGKAGVGEVRCGREAGCSADVVSTAGSPPPPPLLFFPPPAILRVSSWKKREQRIFVGTYLNKTQALESSGSLLWKWWSEATYLKLVGFRGEALLQSITCAFKCVIYYLKCSIFQRGVRYDINGLMLFPHSSRLCFNFRKRDSSGCCSSHVCGDKSQRNQDILSCLWHPKHDVFQNLTRA